MSPGLVEFFHRFSTLLNPMVYFSCILVLLCYARSVKLKPDSMPAWLILGIVISFVGELADNLFWNGAWAAYHARGVDHEKWMRYGPVSNSIFRQLFCVAAAMCHVIPAVRNKEARLWVVALSLMLALFLFWLMSHLGQHL